MVFFKDVDMDDLKNNMKTKSADIIWYKNQNQVLIALYICLLRKIINMQQSNNKQQKNISFYMYVHFSIPICLYIMVDSYLIFFHRKWIEILFQSRLCIIYNLICIYSHYKQNQNTCVRLSIYKSILISFGIFHQLTEIIYRIRLCIILGKTHIIYVLIYSSPNHQREVLTTFVLSIAEHKKGISRGCNYLFEALFLRIYNKNKSMYTKLP